MDKTDFGKQAETLGILEALILSAHKKFFQRNSDAHCYLENEDAVLYETVIRYFAVNS